MEPRLEIFIKSVADNLPMAAAVSLGLSRMQHVYNP